MFVLEVLVAVAVLAAVAMLAAGRFDGLAEEAPDDPEVGVPDDRPLRSSDIPHLRFRLAIRGYRMSDVDEAMAAAQEALRRAEMAALPAPAASSSTTSPAPPGAQPAATSPIEPAPLPSPQPPLQPEPLPPSPPPPLQPEPHPEPPMPMTAEPAEVVTAEQPPTDAEDTALSELEVQASAGEPQAASAPPEPTSWQPPPPLSGP